MIPILFDANETRFDTMGLGALSDALMCEVTESRNGEYELELQYPVTGRHYNEIRDRCIIWAIPSPYRRPQPFRVYRSTKPLNGVCTYYARHISYDLSGVPVHPFTAVNAADAMAQLGSNAAVESPFEFWTDQGTAGDMSVTVPTSTRSILGGTRGSILSLYGGEFEFDRFTVKLHGTRGADNGVIIEYGKNLTDITQDRNIAAVATGIYPYWVDTKGEGLVTCEPKIVPAPGTYDFTKIVPVDFSDTFESAPTPDQLKTAAEEYVQRRKIGIPSISIHAAFQQLEQTLEYHQYALLEKCDLCDTVTVRFAALDIESTAKIVKIRTDVLRDKYVSVDIGNVRPNISDTIIQQGKEIEKLQDPTTLQQAVDRATGWITGGGGYMIAVKDAAGNWTEICSLDNPDINQAINVWRWNNGGLGHSSTGYNGEYTLALTQDGHIVADSITTGTLDAALVHIVNLVADHVRSPGPEGSGTEMEIVGADLTLRANGAPLFAIRDVDDGSPIMYMDEDHPTFGKHHFEATPHSLKIGGSSLYPRFYVGAGTEGSMATDKITAHKTLTIKDGGDPGAAGYDKSKLMATKNSITMVNADQQQLFSVREFKGQMLADIAGSLKTERRIVYDGLCRVGTRFGVYSGFEDCNLFAVRLGTEGGNYNTAVLAYRYGTSIRGIGGACGTKTTQKEVYFVQIKALSTGEWELEDAGYHTIGSNGVWGAGTRLVLRQVDAIL